MRKDHFLYRAFDLYYDGFRHMELGRTLWLVILIKLFVIFVVLKLFFFPNFLSRHADEGQESQFVATQLNERVPLSTDN
jgi:hypothetical protein